MTAKLTCHCLETDQELVLVDTGLGMKDMRRPHLRISPLFIYLDNVQFDP